MSNSSDDGDAAEWVAVGAQIEAEDDAFHGCGTFRLDLEGLINRYSKENGSDTPDFILAGFLDDCLRVFDAAVNARRTWHDG